MNYNEAIEYIHSISWTFCKPGLERINELCTRLGDPQKGMRFVHVVGTNGKGSFCSMLSSVLQRSGYRVGLYTSPYIRSFNERMQVNGQPIENEELSELCDYIKPIADKMTDKPTEFELITAIALEFFKRKNCDVVVLEAGMGGRLDSTNIIRDPLLSVITGISIDHTAFLGDTVEKIAYEKAGVIKDGAPVLFGGNSESAETVIYDTACRVGSKFFKTNRELIGNVRMTLDGTCFDFGDRKDLRISLLGSYQPLNAANVISAVDILRERDLLISESALRDGLKTAKWSARFEVISKDPLVIFDGAHNPEGIASAIESIKGYFGDNKVYLLTGVLRDKDYTKIAKDLSAVAERAFTVTPESPRALPADEYAKVLEANGIRAESFDDTGVGLRYAMREASNNSVPLICLGSLYLYSTLMDEMEK